MKKKHILIKDFFVEIQKSRNRFLSILIIVVLGVAFFSGVRAASPDMRLSADTYFDQSNLMDIRVLSTLGLTDKDVDALSAIKGVENVTPSYSTDVLCPLEDSQPVIHLMALTPNINQITVKEGRIPEKKDEIFMDEDFLSDYDFKVGDTLSFASGNQEELIEDSLAVTKYTIVGSGSSPFYMSLERGNSTIGNGTVSGFGVILMDSFSLEAYTEIYLTANGASDKICYSDDYEDIVEQVKENIEDISDEQCEVRYATLKADGQEDLDAAQNEITDAKEKLQDAKKQLADGEKQLAEGKEELTSKEDELNKGKEQLESEQAALDDGKKQLTQAKNQLNSQMSFLLQQKESLAANKNTLSSKEAELESSAKQLEEGKKKLVEGETELSAAKEQLAQNRTQLEAQTPTIESARIQVTELQKNLSDLTSILDALLADKTALSKNIWDLEEQLKVLMENPLDNGQAISVIESTLSDLRAQEISLEASISQYTVQKEQLEAGIEQAKEGIKQYDDGMAKLIAGEEELGKKEEELAQAKSELAENEKKFSDGQNQLQTAKEQLDAGERSLADGERQLEAAKQLLSSKEAQLAEGEAMLLKAQATLEEGESQLKDAKATLDEKEEELEEAKDEYETESKDAKQKIKEGEEKIADAQNQLDELEVPTWYILGRDSYQTYVEYEQDTQRIGAIGEVFPVIFFLVAALICLTTMTRMVEENRTQIGTLKALGYSKEAIALKYLSYAFLASIAGSVIGFIGGQKVLPVVIINAYGILYNNLPVIQSPIYASYSISSTLLAVAVTTLAAGISCYHELAEVPANLMRPEAPKNGKRILMERFTIVWKHMTFTQKATARNLFRYKKRFFMTVLGIGGCMGLLLVGFGLKDSIMAIGEKQFGEIRIYSSMLSLDEDKSAEVQNDVFELVQTDKDVITSMKALETSVDVGYKKSERSSYLVVASDPELFKKFVNLKDRNSQKMYELDDSGVVITEKLSKLLDVKEGDTIYLKDGDTRRLEVKVSHIVENYFFHYVYMTPTVYRELYEKEPEYTEIFTVNKQNDSAFEDSFQSRYMDVNGVLNVTFLSSMEERIADMLRSMDAIIYVIVIAAGLLAFVVLYNLNNINISERRRELATLKVLGFYDLEVSEYVFKENIFLTLIGAGFGVIFGLILHRFVILTAEIDLMMFGRSIKPISYLYSICLTCLFSFIVNMFMHFKLKKLDMVESMKSVE